MPLMSASCPLAKRNYVLTGVVRRSGSGLAVIILIQRYLSFSGAP